MKTYTRILGLSSFVLLLGVAAARESSRLRRDPVIIPVIVVPSPSSIAAGDASTFTITANQVGTSDTVISLSSSDPSLSIPSTVTLPTGYSTVQFTASSSPDDAGTATITASSNGSSAQGSLVITAGGGKKVRG